MARGNLNVGTAGFSYRDWLGNFYPQFCPSADFLRCYSMTFNTVELDSTFYQLPTGQIVTRWIQSTPLGFKFAAQFPRTVTHEGDLRQRIETAEAFVGVMTALGDKLGPLLMQFPAGFKPDRKQDLVKLLAVAPKGVDLAVQFRDPDWHCKDLIHLLKSKGVALCLTECPGMPKLEVRTADFVYLRLVGNCEEITEDFSYVRLGRTEELTHWAALVRRLAGRNTDVYAYFNNHYSGHAPSTAVEFRDRLSDRFSTKS